MGPIQGPTLHHHTTGFRKVPRELRQQPERSWHGGQIRQKDRHIEILLEKMIETREKYGDFAGFYHVSPLKIF